MLATVTYVSCMDFGASGVWDSPMATDYWVKRFGFMWAGGRSGMHGFEGLQVMIAQIALIMIFPTKS